MWVEVKIRGAAPKKGANYFIHEFLAYLVARFPNLYFGSVQYSWGTWTYLATICIVFQFSEHLAKMQSCLAPWREPANNKIISIISKLNSFFPLNNSILQQQQQQQAFYSAPSMGPLQREPPLCTDRIRSVLPSSFEIENEKACT